ncbi:MAG: histidine kinase [Candidatus Thiodiazotropha sp.]|nr:histidine kinase [Candidatus Thiodiazotropha sp.]
MMDINNNKVQVSSKSNYQLARRYGVISFIAIILTAFVILLFFRYETSQIIQDSSKQSNESLTIATEYALNDHFVMFLNLTKVNKDKIISKMPFEPMLERAIKKMIADTDVDRIKLYDTSGMVMYSSKASAYNDDEDNDSFKSALAGNPKTVLNYQDSFSFFNTNTKDVNLVQTYVPIRANNSSPILGVMEVYYDISGYVSQSDKTLFVLVLVTLALMLFLYFFLLMHIKRSERIIDDQNRITREKKIMLEFLTAKMIHAQEDEKKRIAFELHEDVVQTLSGVKMQLEKYILTVGTMDDDSSAKRLSQDIVPVLQNAAHKIRAVAIDLRPPSLDDFGLKAAINSLVSECHTVTTGLEVEVDLSLNEDEITADRKSILYRIVKDTLKAICFEEKFAGRVQFIFKHIDEGLMIKAVIITGQIGDKYGEDLPAFFDSMKERTILSGGDFFVVNQAEERVEVISSWSY